MSVKTTAEHGVSAFGPQLIPPQRLQHSLALTKSTGPKLPIKYRPAPRINPGPQISSLHLRGITHARFVTWDLRTRRCRQEPCAPGAAVARLGADAYHFATKWLVARFTGRSGESWQVGEMLAAGVFRWWQSAGGDGGSTWYVHLFL